MIIERWAWKTKFGCRSEVVKLVKAAVEEAGLTPRVCTHQFGPYDMVISDLEFETEQDRQKFWAGHDHSKPKIAEWFEKAPDLTESGTTHELLRVH